MKCEGKWEWVKFNVSGPSKSSTISSLKFVACNNNTNNIDVTFTYDTDTEQTGPTPYQKKEQREQRKREERRPKKLRTEETGLVIDVNLDDLESSDWR